MSAFGDFLEKEKNRIYLWLPVTFATGIACYFALPYTLPLYTGFIACIFAFILILAEKYYRKAVFVSLFPLMLALGFTVVSVRADLLSAPVLQKKTKAVEITGIVDSVDIRGSGQRLTFVNPVIAGFEKSDTPVKIRVKVNTLKTRYDAGDKVSLRAVLMPPPMPAMPSAYDIPRKFYFEQLGATGFAVSKVKLLQKSDEVSGFLSKLRADINFRLLDKMPKQEAGIAMSLITGEQGGNSAKVADAYRSSGIAHMLSVSGLHMSMLAGLVFGLVRIMLVFIPAISLRYNSKKIAAGTAIIVTFFYLLISGMNVPALRAFIMVSVVLSAIILDRQALSMRSIIIAFMIILVLYPESLVTASFQMSFAAVFALIAAFEAGAGKLGNFLHISKEKSPKVKKNKSKYHIFIYIFKLILLWIIATVITDFVASSATTPFALYHFDRIAAYSMLTNLITAPILAVAVMPFLLLASLLMPFCWDGWALSIAGFGISLMNKTAFWVESLPESVQVLPAMPVFYLIVITLGGLWLCLWQTRIRLLGLLLIACGFLYPLSYTAPDVLAAQGGKMFAVLSADGKIMIEAGRANKMTRETWLSKNGEDYQKYDKQRAKNAWAYGYEEGGVSLTCKDKLCLYCTKGKTVAIAGDYPALKLACKQADIVFSKVNAKVEYCDAPILIERRQMWNNGTYALYISDNGSVKIISDADYMGKHAWVKPQL